MTYKQSATNKKFKKLQFGLYNNNPFPLSQNQARIHQKNHESKTDWETGKREREKDLELENNERALKPGCQFAVKLSSPLVSPSYKFLFKFKYRQIYINILEFSK